MRNVLAELKRSGAVEVARAAEEAELYVLFHSRERLLELYHENRTTGETGVFNTPSTVEMIGLLRRELSPAAFAQFTWTLLRFASAAVPRARAATGKLVRLA